MSSAERLQTAPGAESGGRSLGRRPLIPRGAPRTGVPAIPSARLQGGGIAGTLVAAVFLAVSAGCGGGGGRTSGATGVRVVTTISPLADLARDLGGGHVEARPLLPPGANPHAYEFRPGDVRAVSEALVVLEVGGDFEPWVDRAVQAAARPDLIVLRGLDHVATMPLAFVEGEESGDSEEGAARGDGREPGREPAPGREPPSGHDHSPGSVDPHFWLDPRRMAELAPHVTEALVRADTANEPVYRAALAAALDSLAALDREVAARLAPFRGVSLLALHATWGYFSDRYGLRIEGVLETFPGQEPGPMTVASLARRARASGVRAIVAEPQQSTRLASVLAAELGVPVLLLDPLGGEGVPGRESYAALLRWNAGALETALSGGEEGTR